MGLKMRLSKEVTVQKRGDAANEIKDCNDDTVVIFFMGSKVIENNNWNETRYKKCKQSLGKFVRL